LGFPGLGFPGLGFPGLGFPGLGFPGLGFLGLGFPGFGFPGLGFPWFGVPRFGVPWFGIPLQRAPDNAPGGHFEFKTRISREINCQPPFGKLFFGTCCFAVDVAKRIPSGKCVAFRHPIFMACFRACGLGFGLGPTPYFLKEKRSPNSLPPPLLPADL
jgi:hypothetical protein